jgi:hypothetical protein
MSKEVKILGHNKMREFEIYASFLALPHDERKEVFTFVTDTEFSKKYNVAQKTLSLWKKDDKLWEARNQYLKGFKKYTANVLRYLYAGMAEKKSASEAMAWFKLVEGYKEKDENRGRVNIPELQRLDDTIRKIIED